MQGRMAFIALATIICLPLHGWATLIVDDPLPITHRVTVQMIQTAKTDGSTPATLFGNTTQEANVKSRIDQIWAQAGIDIDFLPTVNVWNNTFAYQGNAGAGTRPSSDLDSIISLGGNAGVLNSQPEVINIFFVEVVPSFTPLEENTAAGYAKIGFDGITQTVGSSLPGFQNGRDVIASVVAHEIGHNLGLKHPATGLPNLMSPEGTTQQLSAAQISALFQTTARNDSVAFIPNGGTGFPQLLPQLTGDYNQNGIIDAADYTVWRDAMTTSTATLPNDPTPGSVTESDFTYWRAHFGETLTGGSGASTDFLTPLTASAGPATVPEPTTGVLLSIGLAALAARRLRRRR